MNTAMLNMVREFKRTFNQNPTPDLQLNLVEEEVIEVQKAGEAFLKEVADLYYVITGMVDLVGEEEAFRVMREAFPHDGVAAVLLNALDDAVIMEAFARVHESNMSKLGEDGKPIFREDGKVLKGPNYREPDMSDIL